MNLENVLQKEIKKHVLPQGEDTELEFIPCAMTTFVSHTFDKEPRADQI